MLQLFKGNSTVFKHELDSSCCTCKEVLNSDMVADGGIPLEPPDIWYLYLALLPLCTSQI